MNGKQEPEQRPRSAVSAGVGVAGMIGLGAWMLFAHHIGMNGPYAALVALLCCGIPMVLWSVLVDKVHRRPSTGIDWDAEPRGWADALDTGLVKLAGLWFSWGVIAFLYCIGRWYWEGNYLFAMHVLEWLLPPLLFLSIPYVVWLERRLVDREDGAWAVGRWLLDFGRNDDPAIRAKMASHARAWVVKGFFTAFMIQTLPGNWANAINADPATMLNDPVALADGLVSLMFMIDVGFATVGYLLTMRPLDSHIRSANPYAAGWMAALICYPPFVLMNRGGPLDYSPGLSSWHDVLAPWPAIVPLLAFSLAILTGLYAWATVAFGLRFSNLTHRGILTHGPYRFTKHPAYLSKNIFWWLSSMPFVATTGLWTDMVRNTVVLGMVSGVYYWRARTEERHLMADPAYQAYAAWMAEHGAITRIFTRAGRWFQTPEPKAPSLERVATPAE